MLGEKRGFTVIQFIIGSTVVVLLVLAIFVAVVRKTQRDAQRRADLGMVAAMIDRYVANHLGKYPSTKDASDPGSPLQAQFQALSIRDPRGEKYYVLGSDFNDCNGSNPSDHGPGYMSYVRPGDNGAPYKLRVCLEGGKEYYFGD